MSMGLNHYKKESRGHWLTKKGLKSSLPALTASHIGRAHAQGHLAWKIHKPTLILWSTAELARSNPALEDRQGE